MNCAIYFNRSGGRVGCRGERGGHYFESGWHFDYFSDDLALFQIEVEGKRRGSSAFESLIKKASYCSRDSSGVVRDCCHDVIIWNLNF